jgi:nucleotide-binding universal stress UspA family protein
MYKTILMAFDGSDEGRHALSEGAEIARLCEAEVHLLAVMRLSVAAMNLMEGSYPEAALDRDLAAADAAVAEGVAELKRHGLAAAGHRRVGEPVEEIAALAEQLKADLIVLGHRRRGRLARWWQGSLGSTLLDRTNASILVAIAGDEPSGASSG